MGTTQDLTQGGPGFTGGYHVMPPSIGNGAAGDDCKAPQTCGSDAHCEGCDRCEPTTRVRCAHVRGLAEHETLAVRWCDDCANLCGVGYHDHYDAVSLGKATVLRRGRGTLYDGPVVLVRTPSGRVHETSVAEEIVLARIAAMECVHCGRSLAHRRDYEPGELCQRCDVDEIGEPIDA